MTSWLFSSFQLSMLISGEFTTMFSLKIPNEQIDTLQQLLDSKMNLIAFDTFDALMTKQDIIDNNVFNKIKQKVKHDKTSISIREMFQNKSWVIDTSLGKSSMIFARVALKTIVIKYLKEFNTNTRFRFLGERYRQPLLLTLASSMKMSKVFRSDFNLRVILTNLILVNYYLSFLFRVLRYVTTGIVDHEISMALSKCDRYI